MLRYEKGSSAVSAVSALEASLLERDATLDDLKCNLIRTQQRMKQQEDGHRRELEFQVGDYVYLKLQPYRQTSLATRQNEKLAPKFYGPYEFIQRVGNKLQLPPTAMIHNVFHISQLKPAIGPHNTHSPLPHQLSADMVLLTDPAEVLGVRNHSQGQLILTEVLTKWKDLPEFDATWEDYHSILTLFPSFRLEDKVAVWEGGNARPPLWLTYTRRNKKRGITFTSLNDDS